MFRKLVPLPATGGGLAVQKIGRKVDTPAGRLGDVRHVEEGVFGQVARQKTERGEKKGPLYSLCWCRFGWRAGVGVLGTMPTCPYVD